MKRFALLFFLVAAGCVSRDVPKYSSQIEPAGDQSFVIRLQSDHGLTSEQVRRALLTEAARAAIERGSVHLRVDAILDSAKPQARRAEETVPRVPNVSQPDVEKALRGTPWAINAVELDRMRTGYVRFALVPPGETSGNVFDASALLDRLRRGDPLPQLQ